MKRKDLNFLGSKVSLSPRPRKYNSSVVATELLVEMRQNRLGHLFYMVTYSLDNTETYVTFEKMEASLILLNLILNSMVKVESRGIRNKNPFNIRKNPNNNWLGRVSLSMNTDKEFEQFLSMEYGVRAGIILIKNYIFNGYDTPRKILARFAPAEENDLFAYEFFVSGSLGLDDNIIYKSSPFYILLRLICYYESNRLFSITYFQNIIKLFKL